jgi:sterol desaturase/sphingolipid hydroxylase (fatty acid hydroxylase superfamily)
VDTLQGLIADRMGESPELLWALGVYAAVLPLEAIAGTGHGRAWGERLGNIGAMLVHFTVGGVLLALLLELPWGEQLLEYPREPRWALLESPPLYALATVFLVDALFYVYHRLQHAVPLLWHIHKLHHTDPAVNVTTSRRTHFLERPLQFLVLVAPVLWLLGYNAAGMAHMAVLGPFFLYFAHLDLKLPLGPLTPVIVGPQYHRVHHGTARAKQGSNFAQAFPIFDWLGGTYRRPGVKEYGETGVEECRTARSRWRPILW